MPAEHRLQNDLTALACMAAVVFLAIALLSYNPADPVADMVSPLRVAYQPDRLCWSPREQGDLQPVTNLGGRWGALLSDLLFTTIGVGAFYAAATGFWASLRMLQRRPLSAPVLRSLGWLASLAGLTAAVHLWAPQWTPGPISGGGGYLGEMLASAIHAHFTEAGAMILCGSMLLGGALLYLDAGVWRGAGSLTVLAMFGLARGGRALGRRSARLVSRRRGESPAAAEPQSAELEQEDGAEPSIVIGGRQLNSSEDEDQEFDEAESEYDDEESADGDWDEDWSEEDEPAAAEESAEDDGGPRVVRRAKPAEKRQVDERRQVMESLNDADLTEEIDDYELPSVDLLEVGGEIDFEQQAKEVRRKAKILEKTFADFGYKVKVVEIETGPVIAQYEVALEAGLRLAKITGLADDLAIALRVPSVRIVAPIPGKNTVGIEVPNQHRQTVRLREVIEESGDRLAKMRIPLFLGKDVSGSPLTVDLSKMPHLLIAGRTGTGKSVCLNAIISSILMTRRPDEVRMLMIDPKMVELSGYGRLPHLMHPVVTDMKKAEAILAWAVEKMEERYALLARAGVRHLTSYNQLDEVELRRRLKPEDENEWEQIPKHLPFIVIVADEMADLMMTAGKEVEQHIIRLAQKSRAVGIHLILATQKPTVDVITGLIKSNLPARISFQVASRTDSRVVLDEMGAEKLLGNGDMLFLWPGTSTVLRGQGTFLSDEEIDSVVDAVSTGEQNFVHELVHMKVEEEPAPGAGGIAGKRDDLYDAAVEIVINEGRGSVSLLQRCLSIGYGRAARLIDFMAEDGIVGPYNGSQAREVVVTHADYARMKAGGAPGADAAPSPPATAPPPPTRPAETAPPKRPSPPKPPAQRTDAAAAGPPPAKKQRVIKLAENEPWEPEEDDEQESAPLNQRRRSPAVGAAPLDVFQDQEFQDELDEHDEHDDSWDDADDLDAEYDEQQDADQEWEDEVQDSCEEASDELEAEAEDEYDEDEYDEEEYDEDEEDEYEEDEYEYEEVEEDEDDAEEDEEDEEEYDADDEEDEEESELTAEAYVRDAEYEDVDD